MRLERDFFARDVLIVAPEMIGKTMVVSRSTLYASRLQKGIVTEVEAYGGEDDLASHARFGRTKRNEVMYGRAGLIYVYLIYGMYWMLNIVTGSVGEPQGVLIRGVRIIDNSPQPSLILREGVKQGTSLSGPGKVGKWLGLDKSFYGEDVTQSERIWIEEYEVRSTKFEVKETSRIGVDYAGKWAEKKWRWKLIGEGEGC